MPILTTQLNEQSMAKIVRAIDRLNADYIALSTSLSTLNDIEDKAQTSLKLCVMMDIDSLTRNFCQSLPPMEEDQRKWIWDRVVTSLEQVDHSNTLELKKIIERWKWPDFDSKADKAAFLILQHADHDPKFQIKMLGEYRESMDPKDAAYLYDRVTTQPYHAALNAEGPEAAENLARSAEAPKQRYGTQGRDIDGKWQAYPVEDEERLDHRRKKVGLPPMRDYQARMDGVVAHQYHAQEPAPPSRN